MTAKGDCRKVKRAKYHQWLRRRWMERAKAAKDKREARS